MFTAADGFDIVGNCSTNICILRYCYWLIFIIGYVMLHCVNNMSISIIVFDENYSAVQTKVGHLDGLCHREMGSV